VQIRSRPGSGRVGSGRIVVNRWVCVIVTALSVARVKHTGRVHARRQSRTRTGFKTSQPLLSAILAALPS
jgi:hypothetical protein